MKVTKVVSTLWRVALFIYGRDSYYERQRWGSWERLLGLTRIIDTKAVGQLHWNINTWTDDEVMAWKQSYISTCTAVQVAVSVHAPGNRPELDLMTF